MKKLIATVFVAVLFSANAVANYDEFISELKPTSDALKAAVDTCWVEFGDDEDSNNYLPAGQRLANYVACLNSYGHTFDPLDEYHVRQANFHCTNTFWGQMDGGIGWHYTQYQGCLREYGVTPSMLTVADDYRDKVYRSCWGDWELLESVIADSIFFMGSTSYKLMSALTMEAAKKIVRDKVRDKLLTEGATFAYDIVNGPEDVPPSHSYLYKVPRIESFYDIVTNPANLFVIDIKPRALTDYVAYQGCLQDRSIPGLDFYTPARAAKEMGQNELYLAWSERVKDYCYGAFVDRPSEHGEFYIYWQAEDYRQCLDDREYPRDEWVQALNVDTVDEIVNAAAWDACYDNFSNNNLNMADCMADIGVSITPYPELVAAAVNHCESSNYVGGKYADYNAYWHCFGQFGLSYTNDATWQNGVKQHCADSNMVVNKLNGYKTCLSQRQVGYDSSYWQAKVSTYCNNSYYTGGRFADYNAYWTCFTERGTSFTNDATWQSGVKKYCADSNMVVHKLNGYKTCLSQRQVTYDYSYWRSKVNTHCNKSYYTGGKYADYNAYWRCFSERGTSYINNNSWKNGVRNYCARSNVAVGGYNGNRTCVSQRQVSYSSGAWCPVVRNYCASQSYPFAWLGYTEARCRSERRC